MIIVSQDKDNIVNFDNIVSIGINDFDINREITFQRITAETIGTTTVLGDYKTEERAKEVLQEIINKYKQWNKDANNAVTIMPKVYEMPVERQMINNVFKEISSRANNKRIYENEYK